MATRKYRRQEASPEFRLRLTAAQADVDELGHISNIAYVRWVQEAAVAHSEAVGWAHADYLALGAVFVVRKHELEYLRPAYAGDEVELLTHVAWWRAAVTERQTEVRRVSDGALLVRATTLWAMVATATGRPTRIPLQLEDAFYGERGGVGDEPPVGHGPGRAS